MFRITALSPANLSTTIGFYAGLCIDASSASTSSQYFSILNTTLNPPSDFYYIPPTCLGELVIKWNFFSNSETGWWVNYLEIFAELSRRASTTFRMAVLFEASLSIVVDHNANGVYNEMSGIWTNPCWHLLKPLFLLNKLNHLLMITHMLNCKKKSQVNLKKVILSVQYRDWETDRKSVV